MERKDGGEEITHHPMFLVKGPDPIKCQSIISKSVEDANTRSLSVPLEKQTSHLLAISIYLTACVWLIWKTQSTCLLLLRNRPLLCNLQVFCNPDRTVRKGELPGRRAGHSVLLSLITLLPVFWVERALSRSSGEPSFTSQPGSQPTVPLSQSEWVRIPEQACLGKSGSR